MRSRRASLFKGRLLSGVDLVSFPQMFHGFSPRNSHHLPAEPDDRDALLMEKFFDGSNRERGPIGEFPLGNQVRFLVICLARAGRLRCIVGHSFRCAPCGHCVTEAGIRLAGDKPGFRRAQLVAAALNGQKLRRNVLTLQKRGNDGGCGKYKRLARLLSCESRDTQAMRHPALERKNLAKARFEPTPRTRHFFLNSGRVNMG